MISINSILRKDEISPLLDKLDRSGPVVRKVAAKAAAILTRQHFALLASTRHRAAGGALNFYADAAKKTAGRVIGDDIVVVVDKEGVRQRFAGGTIKATRRKYLAIPTEDATGNVPKDFGDELFFFRKGSTAGLALPEGKGMRVMFWLKKEVKQSADSTVMPSAADYIEAIEPEVDAAIQRMTVSERTFRNLGWRGENG
jgi:hypothetical protein